MNAGMILFGIACAWLGALVTAGMLALLYAHGEREPQGERIPTEVRDEA